MPATSVVHPAIVPAVPGVAVRAARTGLGIFATRAFAEESTIGRIPGRVYHWQVLWRRGGEFMANCFRFGDETYLDPGNGLGRYLNHSCRPNAAIRKRNNKLFLFAARDIRPSDEIVIDYSTITGDDDMWRMRCHCGSPQCRTWIGRFGLLPPAIKRRYRRDGLLPDFMLGALE
ncbi:MAG: SET domain-containing protein [Gemmatimonadota bacterium]